MEFCTESFMHTETLQHSNNFIYPMYLHFLNVQPQSGTHTNRFL